VSDFSVSTFLFFGLWLAQVFGSTLLPFPPNLRALYNGTVLHAVARYGMRAFYFLHFSFFKRVLGLGAFLSNKDPFFFFN